jgi:thiamine-monophosphate kinase
LRQALEQGNAPTERLSVGVGDDAAVLDVEDAGSLVVSTDMLMDGVHFVLSECGAARAGHKALGVNLSDLAAMAAEPLAAFVSLALPRDHALEVGRQIMEGMLPLAERFGCSIAGGDTNVWSGPAVINVAVIGTLQKRDALTRSGATPGDWILVTGACGGSLLGRHLDVTPRVREAILLCERYRLHAGIDISDGLTQDLWRITEASHCGAVLDLASVPIHADAFRAAQQSDDGSTPLDHAFGDGEDFELILAAPPDDAARILREQPLDIPITKIGEVIEAPGLWSLAAGGAHLPLTPRGYQHQ